MKHREDNQSRQPTQRGRGFGLQPIEGGAFALVHPGCVEERRDDYEEGLEACRAGAIDEARDILRFALEGCGDNAWVHVALGRIALDEQCDARLARGHFGYVIDLAQQALRTVARAILPRNLPANEPLYAAIEGLIAVETAQRRHRAVAELQRLMARLEGRQNESGIEHTT